MKFLIDNNLSFKLVQPLEIYFPGTSHIRNALRIDTDDFTIWNYARENGFVILTKDNDFDERTQLSGCPPKIIHLICGNQTTQYILNLIISNIENIELFLNADDENCILKIS